MKNEIKIKVDTGSYEYWINTLESNRLTVCGEVKKVIIDFQSARFLEPYHIVSLASLIEEYHQRGAQIEFIKGRYEVDKYLNNIRFYEYWNPGFDRNAFTNTKINTTLCLWHVCQSMIFTYSTQARDYYQNHFFQGKDLDALHIALSEVFNNIYDHSESPVDGYVLTQFYPRNDEIVTAVCDFGKGIPTKINELWASSKGHILPQTDALRAAFVKNVSSKSQPHNKGFGLDNLYSNVQKLKGSLIVLSNSAGLLYNPNQGIQAFKLNKFFQGTLIIVRLNTRYLPEIEEEVDNDEFFL